MSLEYNAIVDGQNLCIGSHLLRKLAFIYLRYQEHFHSSAYLLFHIVSENPLRQPLNSFSIGPLTSKSLRHWHCYQLQNIG